MTGAHLSEDLLLRHSDGEVSRAELLEVENHILACDGCRERVRELNRFSEEIESAVSSVPVPSPDSGRQLLQRAIEDRPPSGRDRRLPGRRWAWGLGLAATFTAAALLTGPHLARKSAPVSRVSTAALEIEGESFIPLPYSNPDLPISSSRIVQMQVPVSSLAEAGIVFEPVSSEAASGDRSVLADVLLGLDGQPLGVHVLEAE